MKPIAYLLAGFIIVAGDACIKDTATNTSTTSVSGAGGSLARFAISGSYLYTVDKSNLKVYDILDAADPVLKNTLPVGFEIETIYPFKDKLFIGSTSVVYIFSIDDPEHPEKLSTAVSPQVLRRCDPVVAKDNVAYATLRTNGPCGGVQSILAVYDISDIMNPVQKITYPLMEPYGLGYSDSALYVCDNSSLLVFNINNPYAPVLISAINDGNYVDVIAYQQTLICWIREGVLLYDISERLNPKLIAKII
ncbi:MAG: hypothetical protein ABI687_03265 [Flavitalea sp.]